MRSEPEGEPERVIRAGRTPYEPGGDVIRRQNGNSASDALTKFVVAMLCALGQPMPTLLDEEEPHERARPRAPRPSAG